MRYPRKRAQRGFTLVVVIVTSFLVLTFVTLSARLVIQERHRDTIALLTANADHALAGIRAWRQSRVAPPLSAEPTVIALDDLLDKPITGVASLRRSIAAGVAVELCEVRIERGNTHVTKRGIWRQRPNDAR